MQPKIHLLVDGAEIASYEVSGDGAGTTVQFSTIIIKPKAPQLNGLNLRNVGFHVQGFKDSVMSLIEAIDAGKSVTYKVVGFDGVTVIKEGVAEYADYTFSIGSADFVEYCNLYETEPEQGVGVNGQHQ